MKLLEFFQPKAKIFSKEFSTPILKKDLELKISEEVNGMVSWAKIMPQLELWLEKMQYKLMIGF